MSTIIKLRCIDQVLTFESTPLVASGGLGEDFLEVSFCSLWDGLAKTAVFWRTEEDAYHVQLDENNTCPIPPEVLADEGAIYFGLFGVSEEGKQRTSEVVRYVVTKGAITSGSKPSDPTPDIYTQLLANYAEVLDGIQEIADAAEASRQAAEQAAGAAGTASDLAGQAAAAAEQSAAALNTHISDKANPHGVTLEQIGGAAAGHKHDAGDITSGTLAIARGGTGVTSNPSMLTNLGTTAAASVFADSPRPGVTGTLPIANGGTGATTASAALTNLGAAAASHNHAAGNITSGTLPVARGGTGLTASPSLLVNLATTAAAGVFAASPRPGVTGTLPVVNGGTGVTSVDALKTALGVSEWKLLVSQSINTQIGNKSSGTTHYVSYSFNASSVSNKLHELLVVCDMTVTNSSGASQEATAVSVSAWGLGMQGAANGSIKGWGYAIGRMSTTNVNAVVFANPGVINASSATFSLPCDLATGKLTGTLYITVTNNYGSDIKVVGTVKVYGKFLQGV